MSPVTFRPAAAPNATGCHSTNPGGCGCTSQAPQAAPGAAALPDSAIRSVLRIDAMDCPTEERLIRKQLAALPAVKGLAFNLLERRLTIAHDAGALPAIRQALAAVGLDGEPETAAAAPTPARPAARWPLVLAGAAALAAEAAHWLAAPAWLTALLALLAIACCGLSTYKKGWVAIRARELNINALMSIAVTGAVLLGEWPEAAMVMVLFAIAERIEAATLAHARDAVGKLMTLLPDDATVRQHDGSWQRVPLQGIAAGAWLRVMPGERIALDGCVREGHSSVNQAPITGESLPQDKAPGDAVFAGSINGHGMLVIEAAGNAEDSTLARVRRAVQQAQASRAPLVQLVDRFARIYTPLVCLLALTLTVLPPLLGLGAWQDWAYRALVLLVIACPCALVISTPVSMVSALANAARHGILIKGGSFLEAGHRLTHLAFDKTGTLTHGQPALTDTVTLAAIDPEQALQLAASLAALSDHPVSQALARAARAAGVHLLPVSAFAADPGRGSHGQVDSQSYSLLGLQHALPDLAPSGPQAQAMTALQAAGKSCVVLSRGQLALAVFALADTVRPGSHEALTQLAALGIRCTMLSGDQQPAATAIGRELGLDDVRSELLPQDKLDAIRALSAQGGVVGMVGDGINDTPALAAADIGFAMGAAGSDSALETADVALMDDDPLKLPAFVRLSQHTYRVLWQNIVLAIGVKVVFCALALAGLGTLWMAVFADMGVSLLVVANALRLLRYPLRVQCPAPQAGDTGGLR